MRAHAPKNADILDATAIAHTRRKKCSAFSNFCKNIIFNKSISLYIGMIFRKYIFEKPTKFMRKLYPKEEGLFYVVAFFYQTKADALDQGRGGNRAELVLKGQDLFYRMLPQIDSLPCGHIIFN